MQRFIRSHAVMLQKLGTASGLSVVHKHAVSMARLRAAAHSPEQLEARLLFCIFSMAPDYPTIIGCVCHHRYCCRVSSATIRATIRSAPQSVRHWQHQQLNRFPKCDVGFACVCGVGIRNIRRTLQDSQYSSPVCRLWISCLCLVS